jgi:hypothetical protein
MLCDNVKLSRYSRKLMKFKCEFCLSEFESTPKKLFARGNFTCSCIDCKHLAATYTKLNLISNKHEFWLNQKLMVSSLFINNKQTFEQFGYHTYDLGSKSKKRVIAKCEFCLNDFESSFGVINNVMLLLRLTHDLNVMVINTNFI